MKKIIQIIVGIGVLAGALLLIIFINLPMVKASYYHYWGINYYLNRFFEQSYDYWQEALTTKNPYLDGSRQDFVTMIGQAYQAGIIFEPIEETHQQGIIELKKSIANHPFNYFYYKVLAEYYNTFSQLHKEYLKEAEAFAAKAAELGPRRQDVIYVMAKTALLEGDDDRGRQLFKAAIDLSPQAADPHFYYGLLLFEAGDKQGGLAELKIAEKLGRKPKTIQEAVIVGNYVGDAGDYQQAIAVYKEALLNRKTDAEYPQRRLDLMLKIAISYYYLGDKESARQYLLEINKDVSLKTSPVYESLRPILKNLGISL